MDIGELLQRIENSTLGKGLTEDEDILPVATDLTGSPDPNPITIVRHTVPKAIQVGEPHFEVTYRSVAYRSIACHMLVDADPSKDLCKHVQVPPTQ